MTTDHFSSRAPGYCQLRPTYPAELFAFLAEQCQGKELAWDTGCGSGQATTALANFFQLVMGTDISQAQIDQAPRHERVRYQVSQAGKVDLPGESCDLVTAAQAIHWFNQEAFFQEAERVLKPCGVLAFWTYSLARVAPEVDRVIDWFYREIVGPYWPPERIQVEENYSSIPFPYKEGQSPPLTMVHLWDRAHFSGYLETWSASILYAKGKGQSPLSELNPVLQKAWPDPNEKRKVTWQLHLRWGKKDTVP
ncbi:MAG: class I SAM-dependent methyltransferase [Gemmataceae bacterium]|nr:class I SAM-dependent methyltransferase [Gemmataceae bacterium]